MRVFGFACAVVLGFASMVQAAPLDVKAVCGESKWVAHVDVDAIRGNTIVKNLYQLGQEKCDWVKKGGFDKIRDQWGIDLRKDLHGMTMYGPKVGEHKAILIVYADVNRKLLEEKAPKASGHKTAKVGAFEIHAWTHKAHGHERPAAGAFFKDNVIVFGGSADDVKAALEVLDGKRPSLAGKDSALTAKVPAGTTVLARAIALDEAKLPVKSPLVKQSVSLSIDMGENEGNSFFHGKLVTKSTETAQQLKAVVDGALALGKLKHSGDAGSTKLVNQVKAAVSDKTITVEFCAPAEEVWKQMQKCMKEMHEKHAKWKEHAKKADGKKADGPKPKHEKK